MLRQAENLPQFFFYMTSYGPINLDTIVIYNDVDIGMAITSAEMDGENRLMVTLIGLEAEKAWHDYAPVGETGNLRQAFRAYKEAVPTREAGTGLFVAGEGYESRAQLRDDLHFRKRNSQPNETDNPIKYVGAIDQGRRPMDATFGTPRSHKKRFAWTGPGGNVSWALRNLGGGKFGHKLTTKSGKNTIARRLKARPGNDFIGAVHYRTGAYAEVKVHAWMRHKGRITPDQLAKIRQEAGIFSGNPFEKFGNRNISPLF